MPHCKPATNYVLRCAAIVFLIDAMGRIGGTVLQAHNYNDEGWALYNRCMAIGWAITFAYFIWLAPTGPVRNLIIVMEYFVLWAALKEFALNPTVFNVAETPLTIYFIYVAAKLIKALLSKNRKAPSG